MFVTSFLQAAEGKAYTVYERAGYKSAYNFAYPFANTCLGTDEGAEEKLLKAVEELKRTGAAKKQTDEMKAGEKVYFSTCKKRRTFTKVNI